MKRGIAIGLLLLGMVLHGAAAATVAPSGDALDAGLSDEARAAGIGDVVTVFLAVSNRLTCRIQNRR